jgi:hypothetical protein
MESPFQHLEPVFNSVEDQEKFLSASSLAPTSPEKEEQANPESNIHSEIISPESDPDDNHTESDSESPLSLFQDLNLTINIDSPSATSENQEHSSSPLVVGYSPKRNIAPKTYPLLPILLDTETNSNIIPVPNISDSPQPIPEPLPFRKLSSAVASVNSIGSSPLIKTETPSYKESTSIYGIIEDFASMVSLI